MCVIANYSILDFLLDLLRKSALIIIIRKTMVMMMMMMLIIIIIKCKVTVLWSQKVETDSLTINWTSQSVHVNRWCNSWIQKCDQERSR